MSQPKINVTGEMSHPKENVTGKMSHPKENVTGKMVCGRPVFFIFGALCAAYAAHIFAGSLLKFGAGVVFGILFCGFQDNSEK